MVVYIYTHYSVCYIWISFSRNRYLLMKKQLFYVYTYTDPRDMKVYYVGKGTGSRMYKHLNQIKNGTHRSHAFVRKTLDIMCSLNIPIIKKVMITDDEKYCLLIEERLINRIGLDNLVNKDCRFKGALQGNNMYMRLRNENDLVCGNIPFGMFRPDIHSIKMIPNPSQIETLRMIQDFKCSGLSYPKIIDALIENKRPNQQGNVKWAKSQIIKMYKQHCVKHLKHDSDAIAFIIKSNRKHQKLIDSLSANPVVNATAISKYKSLVDANVKRISELTS